jgi:hypothetical protein
MKKDTHKTEVIFRKFKSDGSIIALFPYIINDNQGNILSYMHIGQHGSADCFCLTDVTTLAKEEDYRDIYNELNSIGYNLEIKKRRNHDKYLTELNTIRNN